MAKKKSSLPADGRTRNWCAVVYPDSAPENWRDILDGQHICWVESPLHDQDVNPGTGEVKSLIGTYCFCLRVRNLSIKYKRLSNP